MAISLPLDQMTLAEKQEAFQLLLEDLCEQGAGIPILPWQVAELRAREAAVVRGEEVAVDLDEAMRVLRDELRCG